MRIIANCCGKRKIQGGDESGRGMNQGSGFMNAHFIYIHFLKVCSTICCVLSFFSLSFEVPRQSCRTIWPRRSRWRCDVRPSGSHQEAPSEGTLRSHAHYFKWGTILKYLKRYSSLVKLCVRMRYDTLAHFLCETLLHACFRSAFVNLL